MGISGTLGDRFSERRPASEYFANPPYPDLKIDYCFPKFASFSVVVMPCRSIPCRVPRRTTRAKHLTSQTPRKLGSAPVTMKQSYHKASSPAH
jgi:hypothetical protein